MSNLANIYGIPTVSSTFSGDDVTGVAANINDNNSLTYWGFYGIPSFPIGNNFVEAQVTFNSVKYVETIQVQYNSKLAAGGYYEGNTYIYYHNGSSQILLGTYPNSVNSINFDTPFIRDFIINDYVLYIKLYTTIKVDFVYSSRYLLVREIIANGPYYPDSGLRGHSSGVTSSIGEDPTGTSPLIMNNKHIALGTISDNLATGFRFYKNGTTYALLKTN